jgi:hypothetical protein
MTREKALEMITNPRGGPLEGTPAYRELMTYLESSPECRSAYVEQQAVWESLDLWEEVEPSAGFDRLFFDKIEEQQARVSWFARLVNNWRPSFAVGLAGLLLAAAAVLQRQPEAAGNAGMMVAEDAEYAEELHRALDDIEMLAEFDLLPLGG